MGMASEAKWGPSQDICDERDDARGQDEDADRKRYLRCLRNRTSSTLYCPLFPCLFKHGQLVALASPDAFMRCSAYAATQG
jgi:hypothetical protein